jgi:hypothetical protein
MNKVKLSTGEILTGKLWRKEHEVIRQLPFYSNIAGMDDLSAPFEAASQEGTFHALLIVRFLQYLLRNKLNVSGQKFAKGLDEVHPFSDSNAIDVCLRESEMVTSSKYEDKSSIITSRIWGFMSKFVMLDRFSKTLGYSENYPGSLVARSVCGSKYLGTAEKVRMLFFLIFFSYLCFRFLRNLTHLLRSLINF